MCGIAGFIHMNECDEVCTKIENKIQKLQECRGPDAHSTWTETNKGVTYHLFHQRLRIQDLSPAADQPMRSTKNPQAHIVFNGEIYNVDEMRTSFLSQHKFHTHSDTEILLESLALKHPKDVLTKIRGMFAFGLLNSGKNTLLLARDRFGEKPLHFWRDESRVVFASQYDSIVESMKVLNISIEFDQNSIYEYLIYGYFPYHSSLVKGVEKLAPSSYIEISFIDNFLLPKQKLWSEKWQTKSPAKMPFEKLEEELAEAIKLQLIGDVPIGVFLSGGCDSTLVSALAQKQNKSPIHSFSLGFENKAFDESKFALKASQQIGTNHHAFTMTAQDAAEILPHVLKAYPEPLGDPSVFPTTFITREARKYVSVVLTGDGGDELFFGYSRYARFLELEKIDKTISLSIIKKDFLEKIIFYLPSRFKNRVNRLVEFFSSTSPAVKYVSLIGFAHIKSVENLESFRKLTVRSLNTLWSKGRSEISVNRLREIDIDSYLTDDILVKVDRAAMAFSLETRAPFLDQRISYLSTLADANWLYRKEQKNVIKTILDKYVSSDVFRRPKMGFGPPIGDWFRTSLNFWADDLVMKTNWSELGISHEYVCKLWNSILDGSDNDVTYMWILLALASSRNNLIK